MPMPPRLLFADNLGQVYDHPALFALALDPSAAGGVGLARDAYIPLPRHGQLSVLPGRKPVGLDPATGQLVELSTFTLGKRTIHPLAVACVLPPGWTRAALPAFHARALAPVLPQWAYCAVGFDDARGHVAVAAHTDRRTHWNPDDRTREVMQPCVDRRLSSDKSPLLLQLARCALEWRCFTAANIFLGRDEGAIPASTGCNARCLGCISEQPKDGHSPPSSHQRMDDAPDARAMADLGIAHLANATGRTMVSFGQGCEGEPLTRGKTLATAIQLMRKATPRGSINLNTNGSLPRMLELLIDAGLDAARISLNSAHAPLYEAYYQPVKYRWSDVQESIALARRRGVYTALNLLTFPGVVDTEGEVDALCRLVAKAKVDQVQVRSLAIDPAPYLAIAKVHCAGGRPLGFAALFKALKSARKGLVIGNFARGLQERALASRA